jgi:predicted phosphodiesterase
VIAAVLAAAGTSAHAEPARMVKGPYLQNLAPTSITLMWQLERPAPARLVVTGPDGERTLAVEAARLVEVPIRDLQPATRYRYRIEIDGDGETQSWDGELATAPAIGADVPYSFVVVGDTRYSTEAHRRVIERIAQEVPDFLLGTGDLVDEGHRQDQWQEFFDIERALLREVVYFPALGNHDRQGRGRTADNYRTYFSVPETGSETERYYAFSYATARFLVLDSNEHSFALTDQTAWLERELIAARQDPRVRHIFVVMHHPPFSISLHGGNRDLRERWTPLFERYQVTAVFSGHDHVYSRAEHNGLHYFVSGGGGAPLYARRPRPDPIDAAAVKSFERVHHFLRVNVTGTRIEITAIRADGTTIETTAWEEAPPATALGDSARQLASAGAPGASAAPAGSTSGSTSGSGSSSASISTSGSIPSSASASGREPARPLMWVGFAGIGLLLAAAVVVVRTLRR